MEYIVFALAGVVCLLIIATFIFILVSSGFFLKIFKKLLDKLK